MIADNPETKLALSRQGTSLGSEHASSANQGASWSPGLRFLVLVPLALFLIGEVVTRSVAAYLAPINPETAILLRSDNSAALLKLAQNKINSVMATQDVSTTRNIKSLTTPGLTNVPKGVQNSQDVDRAAEAPAGDSPSDLANAQTQGQIRSWAEQALLGDPLNAVAFRILGQVAPGTSRAAFMQAAARHSHHERIAVDWMMWKNFQEGDYHSAIRYANILTRTHNYGIPEGAMAVLGKVAETPGASQELKQLLKSNPPWRSAFFEHLPANISDARTPLDMLLDLRDAPTPPAASEIGPYLTFLIEHGFYDLAHYTWLQFLPPEQLNKAGFLFNGSFELTPSGMPFDWAFRNSGATIEIADRTDGKGARALFMEFGVGRVDDFGVTQLIVLAPGDYQFQGKYKADIVSQRGLEWRVACASKATSPIGQSPTVIGAASDWKSFEFAFTVPETDCLAQSVYLTFTARSASEQFISGTAWFDDLQIVRSADPN